MGASRKKGNQKSKKNGLGNRMALMGITAVVLSLAIVVNVSASSMKEKDLEYQAREANLEKILAEEKSRAAKLEEERIYVQTKQYVEKVAKEKLGLVNPDEILLKPEEKR